MNKAELIEAMVSKTGHSKKATAESLNAFISVVSEALKANDKVQLVGFGTFDVIYILLLYQIKVKHHF